MYNMHKKQDGFSLLIALLVVGVVTGVLTVFIQSQSGEVKRNEARIAGWEGAEIARAARIYARNEMIIRPNLVVDLDPVAGTGPELITVNDLINDGLLPPNFARIDGGGNVINALGQPIRIFMANYPVSGDSALETTVPTAYVIFDDIPTVSPSEVQDIVQSIRARDVAVSAPVFNGAANLTGACNGGGNTTALWDSGCLDTADYLTLTGGAFVPGTFVIPVWRSESFDTRAVMRFPQPEQAGLQTMLTDLTMATMNDCIADPTQFITTTNDDGSTSPTTLCSAVSDDSATNTDNRRSILNVANIENSNGLIINPQASLDVNVANDGTVTIDDPTAIDFNENSDFIVATNFDGTGDARIFGTTTIGGDLGADKTITVLDNSGGTAGSASVGTLEGFNSISNGLTARNTVTFDNDISVLTDINAVNLLDATEVSAQSIQTNTPATINVNNFALVPDPTSPVTSVNNLVVTSTSNIAGTSESLIVERITAENVDIGGTLDLSSNILDVESGNMTVVGNVSSTRIDVGDGNPSTSIGAKCDNDCPKRSVVTLCNTQQAAGLWPVFGYTTLQDCLDAN